MADLKEIDPEIVSMIQDEIETGIYKDTNDVLRSALELLSEQDQDYLALKASLLVAEEQFARGEGIRLTAERIALIRRQAREMANAGHQPSRDVQP